MSAPDDDLTTELNRELRGRSDTMRGSALDFGDVQRKARSIRRRRTATAVVGAAAAVALIVPTAALATHSGHRDEPGPANPSTPTPTQTTTTTADGHQPAPGVLDVSDLPTGAPPRIAYLGRGSSEHPFSPFPATSFTQLNDGTDVVEMNNEGSFEVMVSSPDGAHSGPYGSSAGLAVDPSHSIAAWVDRTGQVMTWTAGAAKPRPLGDPVPGQDLRIAAVTGDDCSLACSVIVNVHDAQHQPWTVDASGSQPLRDGGYLDVNDVDDAGLTIGLYRITDSSTCSKLLGGGEFQGFETCQAQLTSFSPDGRLILGLPSYFDGLGPGGISMYDLSGRRLFERSSTVKSQAYFSEATWEDATHLLAATFQDGKWSLVRIASDGSMEYAVAPAPGPYDSSPFVLPTGG
ncbi:hypothetical protein [Nocardioides cynanchi]|uniref:hypothetical protein n=1 Tax=Nocardioides cynanchi TaxID=2558918 RepID=UPI001247122D|nr:hypothetical protein [Nocardioides cynanchi]